MPRFLPILFVLLASFAPLSAEAASVNFFGPIIPEACRCDQQANPEGGTIATAPAYGCVLQVIQNVIRFGITLGILFATLALVYAGFVWMTSRGNPERVSQGRNLLLNVFVGLAVVLSAWLIVDFIMKTLYREPTEFGPWNSILADTDGYGCLVATSPRALTQGNLDLITNPNAGVDGTATGVGSGGGDRCAPIADANLVAIDNQGHKLSPDAARRFIAMREAAARDRVTLRVTDAYRSPDEQLATFRRHGCRMLGNGRSSCSGTVGTPCALGGRGSNHARGMAVDISLSPGVYQWLRRNASNYGFHNNLPRDLVHWSDTGG
jgi:hypothetical protein